MDRVVHEPARLAIMSMLSGVDQVDFNYLLAALGLSRGNLSSHMTKLCDAGYVEMSKQFVGNVPNTSYTLTDSGQAALAAYWVALDSLRKPVGQRAGSDMSAVRRQAVPET